MMFFSLFKNKIILLLFLTINNIFVQILYAMSEKELIILLKMEMKRHLQLCIDCIGLKFIISLVCICLP